MDFSERIRSMMNAHPLVYGDGATGRIVAIALAIRDNDRLDEMPHGTWKGAVVAVTGEPATWTAEDLALMASASVPMSVLGPWPPESGETTASVEGWLVWVVKTSLGYELALDAGGNIVAKAIWTTGNKTEVSGVSWETVDEVGAAVAAELEPILIAESADVVVDGGNMCHGSEVSTQEADLALKHAAHLVRAAGRPGGQLENPNGEQRAWLLPSAVGLVQALASVLPTGTAEGDRFMTKLGRIAVEGGGGEAG